MNRFWSPTLGDVTEPVRTWNPVRDAKEAFQYIDLSAVDQDAKAILGAALVEPEDAPSRARQVVRTDDILVSTVRPNLNAVARVPEELDGTTASTGFCVLRPTPGKVDPTYLFHWVRTPRFVDDMVRNATGASYPAVSDRIVKASVFPLPPLDEQRRIAAILDKADALRQKRKRAIALLDGLTQSSFLEMFDTNQGDWATLGEITDQITDGAHFTPTYVDVGVPFLRVTDIQDDSIDWATVKRIPAVEHEDLIKRCRPEHGDVLLSKNGTIGIPRLVNWSVDFSIFVSLALIKPKRAILRPEYLLSFLRSPIAQTQLRQHAKTGTVTNLHLVEIRKLKLPLPSLAQQARWCDAYAALQAQARQLQATSVAVESLFASLQHRAFSGQL